MPPIDDDLRRLTAKSLGEQFVESETFKTWGLENRSSELDASLEDLGVGRKATITTTGDYIAPSGFVGLSATEPIQVIDLIPVVPSPGTFIWSQEVTYNNTAAETAEGAAAPELDFVFEERRNPLKKIPALLPVVDEIFEDDPNAEEFINSRMEFAIRQRVDRQVLVGDGTGVNLTGFNVIAGTNAFTYDPALANPNQKFIDAVIEGAHAARTVGKAFPHAVVFHPDDFRNLLLAKDSNRQYLRFRQLLEDAGLTPVQSSWQPTGTALVGDFQRRSRLAARRGIEIDIARSNTHSTFFGENKTAVRATVRAFLAVIRPAAFSTVKPV